jgi:hypothetical protein
LVALSVSRESSLIAPPTGAVNNRSAKAQIEALPVSSPTFSTASTQNGHRAFGYWRSTQNRAAQAMVPELKYENPIMMGNKLKEDVTRANKLRAHDLKGLVR